MDTQPADRPAADDARADGPIPMEVQHAEARGAANERARIPDDVEDAVETVTTTTAPRRSEAHDRPTSLDQQHLAPLFSASVAQDFRARWDTTQIGFVDDPRQAVQQADELVAQVMNSLAQSFSDARTQLETQRNETASTENLRVAMQRYRSFFQRLLSL
jgi:hypothetical protein